MIKKSKNLVIVSLMLVLFLLNLVSFSSAVSKNPFIKPSFSNSISYASHQRQSQPTFSINSFSAFSTPQLNQKQIKAQITSYFVPQYALGGVYNWRYNQ